MQYLAVVDDFFLDRPGGAARVAWDVACAARDVGHDVTMLCRHPENNASCSDEQGIRVVRYGVPDRMRWNSGYSAHGRAAVSALNSANGSVSPDVVHCHSPVTADAIFQSMRPEVRRVYTMHSPVWAEQIPNWKRQGLSGLFKRLIAGQVLQGYERRSLAQSNVVHTLSQYTAHEASRLYPSIHPVVIPHFVREKWCPYKTRNESRALLGWPADRPIIFTLRNHVPRTGIDRAISAVGPLTLNNRCSLIIGGDGPQRKEYELQARKMGASPAQIFFTGRISDEELMLAYQAADLFLLPTIALECFGLIILEAFAMGLPVMAFANGAIPELLQPICSDFLVPVDNVLMMQNKLNDWLHGRLMAPDALALKEYVAKDFSASQIAQRLMGMVFDTHNSPPLS